MEQSDQSNRMMLDKRKIMIVDDQSFNIDALIIILRFSLGISNIKKFCDRANDGQEALKLI